MKSSYEYPGFETVTNRVGISFLLIIFFLVIQAQQPPSKDVYPSAMITPFELVPGNPVNL